MHRRCTCLLCRRVLFVYRFGGKSLRCSSAPYLCNDPALLLKDDTLPPMEPAPVHGAALFLNQLCKNLGEAA
jgi:hypothetical protein